MKDYDFFRYPIINGDWVTVARLIKEEGRDYDELQASSKAIMQILLEEGLSLDYFISHLPPDVIELYSEAGRQKMVRMITRELLGRALRPDTRIPNSGSISQSILGSLETEHVTEEDCAACESTECPTRLAPFTVH